MKAPRLASFAAVAAAFLYLGCFTAAAQTAAAPEAGASIKPIMAPPVAAKKSVSTRSSARRSVAKDSVHVYLFRGLLNVFSLGMDELADKIRATGIAATVYNHTEWEEVAGQIAANYKNGNHAPIILIGHSLGADAVMYMGQYLGKRGIPVALIVPFDGTQSMTASANVAQVMNITQRDYAYMRRGAGFHGQLSNVDVSGEGVDHLSIDKSPRLHSMVLSRIAAVVKKGEVPGTFATAPDEKEQAKPAPKPEHEIAARPEPAPEAEKPATEIAAKPGEIKPESEPLGAPPAAKPAEMAPAAAPASPAVSAAVGTASPQPPISAPALSAPQPVSAAPAASIPAAVPAPSTAPAPVPAPQRLEYEKLVLPKQ